MSGKRNVSVCRGHELANALYEGVQKTLIVFAYGGNIATLFVSGALSQINFDGTHP